MNYSLSYSYDLILQFQAFMNDIIEKYNLSDEEFVYIGDDVNDFDSLNRAKYAITVPSAVEKIFIIIKKINHFFSSRRNAP